ncbi:MAG: hypothetical protein ACK5LC_16690 [Coprobacillaceae bacterium]
MKRSFYINNIDNDEELNKLSIAINALEETSRIKIGKDMISFECAQPESIETIILDINPNLVLRERVKTRNRKFNFTTEKQDLIFMFTNLDKPEDAEEIEGIVSKYSMYENVSVDFHNKLLKVRTSDRKALVRLNRIVDKVNPNIDVEQWKRPFKSQDIFNEKYLKNYLRIGILLLAVSLGLVTKDDPTILTNVGWLLALLVICEPIIKKVQREFSIKRFFSENSAILISCLLGWVYGAYGESLLVALLYRLGEWILISFSSHTMRKINDIIDLPQVGRKEIDGEIIMSSLDEFDIGDILVVSEGETIPLGGEVIAGKSTLDTYSVNGSKVEEPISVGQEVQSGSINLKSELKIKVLYGFERSALSKIVNIATLAPASVSKTQKVIELISRVFSMILVASALISGVILPLMDYAIYGQYMYLAAILLILAGTSAYKQFSSFAVLAGVATAFSKGIVIKENSGLDALNACTTIIYDRFDGVEVNEEELALFAKLKDLHKRLIIFNDGPVDLENDQYEIYNDLSVEEKMKIMEQVTIMGPVAYIGDSFKDVALLQKAYVGISRGGLHDYKVVENCDIMITNSDYDTIIDTFLVSKKQRKTVLENMVLGIIATLLLAIFASVSILPWWLAMILYNVVYLMLLLNTHRVMK